MALAACASPNETGTTATSAVEVTLEDFAVRLAQGSVPAGEVTFRATNAGPSGHELMVIKTDLDPAALPTTSTRMLDPRGAGVELVGETEGLPVGESGELTVTLASGKYILLCNIYDDAGAHFGQGMLTAFTVTD